MARLQAFFNVLEEANRSDVRERRNFLRLARYNNSAMEMDSTEFLNNYRLTKELFEVLVADLSPLMKKPTRRSDITIECKILLALSFYGTGSYQRIVGRSRGTTVSQQSVSKAIRDVTKALNSPEMLSKYFKFPTTTEEKNLIKRQFYEKFHIPNVIGCIDGTQIAIIRPKENEERFFNRKHFHSRNVQIVCDSKMNILNVDATFGGATHDSFIFNQSPIKDHLSALARRGETLYLLGDSGYPQREYLMTPVINAQAGSPEEFYSKIHILARNVVERTIGLLKAKWRCLLRHRVLHYDPETAGKIIIACCVLHNLCIGSNDLQLVMNDEVNEEEDTDFAVPGLPSSLSQHNDELRRGQEARQRLINHLWTNRRQ